MDMEKREYTKKLYNEIMKRLDKLEAGELNLSQENSQKVYASLRNLYNKLIEYEESLK